MIEVIHYINRWGKQEHAVIHVPKEYEFTPSAKNYAMRYAAGELPPYYPLPVPNFPGYHLVCLRKGYWWLYWYRMGLNPPRWPTRWNRP